MALFHSRKTRTSKAAEIRPSASFVGRSVASLQNRSIAGRLAMCLVAILTMLAAVEAWEVPFPYRLGDRSEQGITAKIDFERVDVAGTEILRIDAESRVPYFFQRIGRPNEALSNRLSTALADIAQNEDPNKLSPQTLIGFGLNVSESSHRPGSEANIGSSGSPKLDASNEDFVALRAAVAEGEGTPAERIADFIAEFERFLSPIRDTGLADPVEIERLRLRPEQQIHVVTTTESTASSLYSPQDLILREMLKGTGDLSNWQSYPKLSTIRPQLERWLQNSATASLKYDSAATQRARRAARDAIPPATIRFNEGNLLLPAGNPIDGETLEVLQAEYDQINRTIGLDQRIVRMATVFVMLVVLAGLNGYYLVHNEPRLVRSLGRLSIYLTSLVVAVALSRVMSFDPWRAEMIPFMAVVMIFAIAYNQVLATIIGFTLALIITVSTVGDLSQFILLMSVAAVAVIPLSSVPSRSTIIKVGFWAGLAYMAVAAGLGIMQSQSSYEIWKDTTLLVAALRGAGWCLVAGYLVAGSLPFIEKTFGVVTDISLLEMSDISHPLLQELVRRAPGTYNHSIAVATIGETAADRIGANGLLVRVGAYYHDIGKMLKPQYFVENMTEGSPSRHEHLAPAMSTLIIIGHVKDGVDLARRHNLPQPLIDFIEQHHGTTLVEYFYREAARIAEQQDKKERSDVEESSFRYPGPKPQTRELGVMMIADAVESASRTLSEPTPKRIEGLVHNIVMKRLLDGQFDECSLTLNELRVIEDSLTKSLIGIYHGRIKYPEQRIA